MEINTSEFQKSDLSGKRRLSVKRSRAFEFVVIVLIMIASVLEGIKTYDLPLKHLEIISTADNIITFIFLVELAIRFTNEKDKYNYFKDPWNVFDCIIILFSLIPLSYSDIAITARLLRIFRVLRMIYVVPRLRVLMGSLLKSLPQLGYVMMCMFIIFYIYAAVGATIFKDINPDLWGNISVSLLTLFRVMTFEDWTDVQYETMEVYPQSWIFYLSFIFLTAFSLLNMIIGIIVANLDDENSQKEATTSREDIEELKQEIRELKEIVKSVNLKE